MQHLNLSSMPTLKIGDNGSVTVVKKHYDVDENQREFLDPKNLPPTINIIEKSTTTNNDWRKGMQGFFIPEKGSIPGFEEFNAINLSEKKVNQKMHKIAVELEQAACNWANNPINLASQMYDLMAMYNKKMK